MNKAMPQPPRAIKVWVAAIHGSTPREVGATLWVSHDKTLGTIGGGHLELQAIHIAHSMLQNKEPSRQEKFTLGAGLGQCCGGIVELCFSETALPVDLPLPAPLLHLVLFGAGHVGRALVHTLLPLPIAVRWVDSRPEEMEKFPDRSPLLTQVVDDDLVHEVDQAPAGSAYLIMTHDHTLDLALSERILRRGDFVYCGLIGSRTKRQRFLHRLQAQQVPNIARLTCPIGLSGITGKAPATIAIAVAASLMQIAEHVDAHKKQESRYG